MKKKKPTSCLLPSFIITHVLINRQEEQDKQDAVVIYFELKWKYCKESFLPYRGWKSAVKRESGKEQWTAWATDFCTGLIDFKDH